MQGEKDNIILGAYSESRLNNKKKLNRLAV